MDLANLEKVCQQFKTLFPQRRICSLHGQMKGEEKNTILENFKLHRWDILIATSVIEVGIDIPRATIMAVLDAHRFGLSSLHQLRGRVGRGSKMGFFFLISGEKNSSNSLKRMKVFRED